MTTTASKHGLRKVAQERTSRHAQRTALPPKAGVVAEAREIIADHLTTICAGSAMCERPANHKGRHGKRTVTEERNRDAAEAAIKAMIEVEREEFDSYAQAGTGADPETDAIEAAPDSPLGRRAAREAKIRDGQARKRARRTEEDAAEEAAKPAEAAPAGDSKANRAAPKFTELGWDATVQADGPWAEVIARRGPETIHQGWLNGVYDHERSGTYTIGDRTVKTRNMSEALKWAARSETAAAGEFQKVNANTHFRKRPVGITLAKGLPFDPETATDEEIIEALAGHKVQWQNVYRVSEEEASIPKASVHTRVVTMPSDSGRAVLFCCKESGFRAFRVGALTRIGRTRV